MCLAEKKSLGIEATSELSLRATKREITED